MITFLVTLARSLILQHRYRVTKRDIKRLPLFPLTPTEKWALGIVESRYKTEAKNPLLCLFMGTLKIEEHEKEVPDLSFIRALQSIEKKIRDKLGKNPTLGIYLGPTSSHPYDLRMKWMKLLLTQPADLS